jgi:diketogulonate reductase-like aldo/keto reductase
MLELRDEGLAHAIGVSNYSTAEIDDLTAATGEVPEVNQICWSPFLYDPSRQRELDRRGVVLEGYRPFKESRLDDPVITEIAAAIGATPAQVVLRWHIQHRVVVIPKSIDPDRIAKNFDVFNFSLDANSMRRLDDLSSR